MSNRVSVAAVGSPRRPPSSRRTALLVPAGWACAGGAPSEGAPCLRLYPRSLVIFACACRPRWPLEGRPQAMPTAATDRKAYRLPPLGSQRREPPEQRLPRAWRVPSVAVGEGMGVAHGTTADVDVGCRAGVGVGSGVTVGAWRGGGFRGGGRRRCASSAPGQPGQTRPRRQLPPVSACPRGTRRSRTAPRWWGPPRCRSPAPPPAR